MSFSKQNFSSKIYTKTTDGAPRSSEWFELHLKKDQEKDLYDQLNRRLRSASSKEASRRKEHRGEPHNIRNLR